MKLPVLPGMRPTVSTAHLKYAYPDVGSQLVQRPWRASVATMIRLRHSFSIYLLLTSAAACSSTARAESGQVRYVTDGDTFRLTSGERIRIANIDAPEIHARQAKCPLEIERGEAASAHARTLLEGKTVSFERVGRSYNRTVARVRVDGHDLGEALIAAGAAIPWLRHHPNPTGVLEDMSWNAADWHLRSDCRYTQILRRLHVFGVG